MLDGLLAGRDGLSRFFYALKSSSRSTAAAVKRGDDAVQRTENEGAPLLPMRLPFVRAEWIDRPHISSSRRRRRQNARVVAQLWTNRLVTAFSFFELGSGAADAWARASASGPVTRLQLEYAETLAESLLR